MKERPTRSRGELALLAGRYRHDGELGRGASGRVIALVDADGARAVAKVLAPDAGLSARWEFDALLSVESPHLARAIELLWTSERVEAPFSLPKGSWALVQARAPGEPSSSVLGRIADADTRAETIRTATLGVARALSALHERGLVHGDVKPDNVLIEADHATLVDLGAAAPFGRHPRIDGTLAFMAPEAREGERSPSTDLYALGATIVAWWRGSPPRPFEAIELGDAMPAALAQLTRQLISPRIADRPPDAAAVLAALGAEPPTRTQASGSARPARRGLDDAITKLTAILDARGWAVVLGPSSSGRSRLIEETLRAIQRRELEAGRETPAIRVEDAWPPALSTPTLLHVVSDAPPEELAARAERALAEGRIRGHAHRVVVEREDGAGLPDERVVHVPTLDPDDVEALLSALLGERPARATVRAAIDATGGFPGRIVHGARLLASMSLDPRRAREWALATRLVATPQLSTQAALVADLTSLLGGELRLDGSPPPPEHAEGARQLIRAGLASIREDGALFVHGPARRTISAARRRRLLEAARGLPLAGLSRAILDAHGAHAAEADREALRRAHEARERGDPEQALDELTRYLDAVPTRAGEEREALRLAQIDAARAIGDVREAREALERASLTSPAARIAAAELARLDGDAERAIAIARAIADDPREGAAARAIVARAALTSSAAQARATARALVEAAGDGDGDDEAVASASETLALLALGEGDALEALTRARAGRRAASAIALPFLRLAREARLASIEAQALAGSTRIDEARRAYRESARLASASGDRLLEATFGANDGLAALEAGELGRAIASLRASASLFLRLARPRELGRTLANLANAHALAGDDARAEQMLTEARSALEHVDDLDARALVAIVASELTIRRGKLTLARAGLDAMLTALSARDLERSPTARVALARRRVARVLEGARAGTPPEASPTRTRVAAHAETHPLVLTEDALADAREALGRGDARLADELLEGARAEVLRGRVGFEARCRTLALEIETFEALHDKSRVRSRLSQLRAWVEIALRDLPPERSGLFRQIPSVRRALAEGEVRDERDASLAQRALDGAAALAREPNVALFEEQLVALALELAAAERAFLVEWRAEGLRVRARAGVGEDDPSAKPSSTAVARALRETLVVSTDAVHERDASSSVHALALRSVLAIELAPRPKDTPPRVLVLDDPLRPHAFDASVVSSIRALAEIAGPLLHARSLADPARRPWRDALPGEALVGDQAWVEDDDPFADFVHEDASSQRLVRDARRLAATELPVLIVGETGVGKDLLARAIHRSSPRGHAPFVAVRGANLTGSLADATIFGHARGAFTGAEERRAGLFELSHRGTLYLDGLDEIPVDVQAKLLRVLVEGEVRALGAPRTRRVDVRIVGSMRGSPDEAIARGAVREDFYYRVAGASLEVPPLRERRADLAILLDRALARAPRVSLTARAREALLSRSWPGNARELEHTLALARLTSPGRVIDLDAFAQPAALTPASSLHARRGELTRELVLDTLERLGGNRTHAARELGLSRYGLQKILRRLGVEPARSAK